MIQSTAFAEDSRHPELGSEQDSDFSLSNDSDPNSPTRVSVPTVIEEDSSTDHFGLITATHHSVLEVDDSLDPNLESADDDSFELHMDPYQEVDSPANDQATMTAPMSIDQQMALEERSDLIVISGFGEFVEPMPNHDTVQVENSTGSQTPSKPKVARLLPKIPGYDVLKIQGRGGMGIVYVAQQLTLFRLVAIKMVSDTHSEDNVNRFLHEAESIARIQHPNIIQVMDSGIHENGPFFVMEYVRGGSLAKRLKGGVRLPIKTAVKLALVLTHAVEAAHARGVIHRDLKPSNVLIVEPEETPLEECTLKLGDFGLAKRIDIRNDDTSSHRILGSPNYVAPEQAQSQHELVKRPADIYSLGVMIYEMLVGRPPFRNENPLKTLQQVINDSPVPPRKLRHDIPEDLQTICLKCLEKEPRKRYQTAQELANDLESFLVDQHIQARKATLLDKYQHWLRRNRTLAMALAWGVVGWLFALILMIGYIIG